ncbi:hypothetical protein SS50377_28295 [Spironucleus salmonicida]|uniref:Uncharacterized protein n=1 Tax=Spironucleus salmonicida TaxID=348837 RepID=V6LY08_9EUKA|nr:hypothetical protein SS50377_28295 [Spironucleus salmonicida]|eukprot:EST49138.1 Hypothetical protein SS50377_10578 [Spironucleus salmonicida]
MENLSVFLAYISAGLKEHIMNTNRLLSIISLHQVRQRTQKHIRDVRHTIENIKIPEITQGFLTTSDNKISLEHSLFNTSFADVAGPLILNSTPSGLTEEIIRADLQSTSQEEPQIAQYQKYHLQNDIHFKILLEYRPHPTNLDIHSIIAEISPNQPLADWMDIIIKIQEPLTLMSNDELVIRAVSENLQESSMHLVDLNSGMNVMQQSLEITSLQINTTFRQQAQIDHTVKIFEKLMRQYQNQQINLINIKWPVKNFND